MYGLGQGGVELSLVYNRTAPVKEVEWLASVMSEADFAEFPNHLCEDATREAWRNGDWQAVADAIWGGSDHEVSTACGRALVLYYLTKDSTYNKLYGPGPEPMTAPPSVQIKMPTIRITPKAEQDPPPSQTGAAGPAGAGMSSGLMTGLVVLGFLGVVLGSRRR